MLFYELTDNSAYEKKWTIAVSIHPKSHVVKWLCPDCVHAAQYPAGAFDVTVEGGSAFPDILSCGAYPLLIASERVISVCKGAGITCFQAYPVGVAALIGTRLVREKAPAYFRLEITGECMIDFVGSGAIIESICGHCGEATIEPPVISRFRTVEGSWDGCDWFRDRRYFPRVSFCTQKFVDLAKANGLTNFRFQQMG